LLSAISVVRRPASHEIEAFPHVPFESEQGGHEDHEGERVPDFVVAPLLDGQADAGQLVNEFLGLEEMAVLGGD